MIDRVPRPLRREFPGHVVRTIREMGWSGKKNGARLGLMTGAGLEVLLTVDRNPGHQRNSKPFGIAVVVMVAPTNRLDDLIATAPAVELALLSIKPGDAVEAHA